MGYWGTRMGLFHDVSSDELRCFRDQLSEAQTILNEKVIFQLSITRPPAAMVIITAEVSWMNMGNWPLEMWILSSKLGLEPSIVERTRNRNCMNFWHLLYIYSHCPHWLIAKNQTRRYLESVRTFVKGILWDLESLSDERTRQRMSASRFALCLDSRSILSVLRWISVHDICVNLKGRLWFIFFEGLVYCFTVLGYCNCDTKAEPNNMILRGV